MFINKFLKFLILISIMMFITSSLYAQSINVSPSGKDDLSLAISVGVNDFMYMDWLGLNYAVKDAVEIDGIMRKQNYETILLTSNDPANLPLKEKVIDSLLIARTNAEQGVLKKLVLYISTHGNSKDGTNYIFPMDVKYDDLKGTAISTEYMFDILYDISTYGVQVVVFLDACRKNTSSSKRDFKGTFDNYGESRGIRVFYSTAELELSWENSEFENGVFTEFLIEGLSGNADLNSDGAITFDELTKYVSNAMLNYSTENNKYQYPTIETTQLKIDDEFIIAYTDKKKLDQLFSITLGLSTMMYGEGGTFKANSGDSYMIEDKFLYNWGLNLAFYINRLSIGSLSISLGISCGIHYEQFSLYLPYSEDNNKYNLFIFPVQLNTQLGIFENKAIFVYIGIGAGALIQYKTSFKFDIFVGTDIIFTQRIFLDVRTGVSFMPLGNADFSNNIAIILQIGIGINL